MSPSCWRSFKRAEQEAAAIGRPPRPGAARKPEPLFHHVAGDFDQPGHTVAGKQRNAQRHSAEARAERRDADVEFPRSLVIGPEFMKTVPVALIADIRRTDH